MNVSSHSLFHYTPAFDNLFGIITKGFRFALNEEEMPLNGLVGDADDLEALMLRIGAMKVNWYADVISFSDIPLAVNTAHRAAYGNYAIGLKKEWAMKSGVTPIRYVHQGSPDFAGRDADKVLALAQGFVAAQMDVVEFLRTYYPDLPSAEEVAALPPNVIRLIRAMNETYKSVLITAHNNFSFMRIAKGRWDRTNEDDHVFYNEREWRAIGERGSYLPFSLSDVNCIIVLSDSERDSLLGEIKNAGLLKTANDERLLDRKILTWHEATREL